MIIHRKERAKRSKIWTLPREILEKDIKESRSLSEFLRKHQLCTIGGTPKVLKLRLEKEGIDYSHIVLGQSSNSGKKFNNRGLTIEECRSIVFIEFSTHSSHCVRNYIKKYKLLEYRCLECNLENIWNNKNLSLQLDHKNGINNDNRLENLRWLCPNCHSQTCTFGTKNHKKKDKKTSFCSDCGKQIGNNTKNKLCLKCLNWNNGKVDNKPSKEYLIELIKSKPVTQIAKQFNILPNSIRKWCVHYRLDIKDISPFSNKNKWCL